MSAQNTFSKFILFFSMAAILAGCGKQNTYQADSDTAKTLEAQAKKNALAPAVGDYSGTMHMIQSDMDFTATLSLEVNPDNVHSSDSTDPTDTAEVPKLQGGMRFPAIDNAGSAAYATLPDLMQATGGYGSVSFSYGDYVPSTRVINLPFTVSGHDGDYGSVTGTLSYDKETEVWRFAGVWYSNSSQKVGTFVFTRKGSSS